MEKIDHIKILLKNGADPNITNEDGLSPLHTAVNKQNITIVKLLLKYGANPNIKSKLYQQTPLHLAIKNNADPIFLLLLVQFNGSLLERDKFEKRPIDYICSQEMQDAVEKWIKSDGFVLKVPSAIIQEESNYLINPKHKRIADLKILDIQDFSLDERLKKLKI